MDRGRVDFDLEWCRTTRAGHLRLDFAGLTEVPPEVLGFDWLESVSLCANEIASVPDELARLPRLRRVDLRANPLYRVPALPGLSLDWTAYERCRGQLRRAGPVGIRVDTAPVPRGVWKVPRLQRLDFGRWRASEPQERGVTPAVIERVAATWPGLEELDLYFCGLGDLPAAVAKMPQLRELDLTGNPLERVPDALRGCEALTWLRMERCGLTSVPDWLFSLRQLARLSLGYNGLRDLPTRGGMASAVARLDLSGNPLEALPRWIGELPCLESLTFRDTDVGVWPRLAPALALRRVHAGAPDYVSMEWRRANEPISTTSRPGRLTTIPPEILDLPALEELDVSGQPITTPPQEVVSRGLDAIRDYWRQRREAGTDYLCEAKLIIVGEAGAGKTSLARKILDPSGPIATPASTEGIEISRWTFPTLLRPRAPGADPVRRDYAVNLWDFGGQEVYHATHQFFLTRRSVYVLVADSRKEDTDFHYWLSVVQLLSGGSPVLIVKNEKDDRRRDLDEAPLRARYPSLRAVLATNLADNRGLDGVLAAIRRELEALPHVGDALPMPWRKVRSALESDPRDHLSLDAFVALCAGNGFTRREDALHLSGYLHDLGICLHFQDDPVLRTRVILRPSWGTEAVYRVLDSRAVQEARGRFSDADLATIWTGPAHVGMRHELLQLMMKFELAYRLHDGSYIAPQLLSPAAPAWEQPRRWDLTLRWRYEFMPKGVVSRLIVALNAHVAEQGRLVWRTGVVLDWEGCRALVTEDQPGRLLTVRATGADRRALLAMVREEVRRIHGSFPGLVVEEEVPCPCAACATAADPERFTASDLRRFDDAGRRIQCRRSFEDIDPKALMAAVFGGASTPPPPVDAARELFLSYAWRADTAVVDRLSEAARARGFRVVRDKDDVRYKESVRAFMTRLGRGNVVVAVLSRAYLESPNCWFELAELADNPAFRERVFPVLLPDARIHEPKFRLAVVKHWEKEIAELDAAMKEVEASDLGGIREEIDAYRRYRTKAAGVLALLGDMRPLNHAAPDAAEFTELLDAIEKAYPR